MVTSNQMLETTDIGSILTVQIFTRKKSDPKEIWTDSLQKFVGTLVSYSVSRNAIVVVLNQFPPITINPKLDYHEFYAAGKEPRSSDEKALDDIARILSESDDWGSDEMSSIFHIVDRVREVNTTTEIMPSIRGWIL